MNKIISQIMKLEGVSADEAREMFLEEVDESDLEGALEAFGLEPDYVFDALGLLKD